MSQASVQAPLRYLVPGVEKPVYIASRGGEQAQLSINADFENRRVTIRNARRLKSPARLDREGFTLTSQHTKISDFYQLERYRNNYEAELTPLVLAETGANELVVFDHTLRSNSPAVRGLHLSREAATVIHNDYSDASAEQRLRDFLTASEAEKRMKNRYAIVNAWRSIRDPVVQSPLALCDTRTISDQDLVTSERRAMDRIGELQLVSWNPEHQWYYYPLMNRDEVLLIKTFDSARDGRARRSIHTAFIDPSAPEEAPPRESIESRILVFY